MFLSKIKDAPRAGAEVLVGISRVKYSSRNQKKSQSNCGNHLNETAFLAYAMSC